jgi:hypothetical protein
MAPDVTPAYVSDASAPRNGWWKDYTEVIPSGYQDLIAAEEDAEGVLHFHPTLVPGLLQTERYAFAITKVTSLKTLAPEDVRSLVKVRMERQRSAFDSARPKRLTFFLDEGCLRRSLGSPDVMREQLQHLLELTTRPNVTLIVIPSEWEPHPGLLGAFMLLENRAGVGDVVCFEWPLGNWVHNDPDDVRKYRMLADTLLRAFPDAADTHRLIESAHGSLAEPLASDPLD